MKITTDTNVLVRAVTQDDPVQGPLAREAISAASLIAVTLPALCEFCWVLDRLYHLQAQEIAAAIRVLVEADNVAVDRQGVEAGLALLDAGGDFADGVIAHAGRWLGAETFVSFDKKAVRLLQAQGEAARVPA